MSTPVFSATFLKFARGLVDLTPGYNSSNKEIILTALDNMPREHDRPLILSELRVAIADLASGQYPDKKLVSMLWTTGARVVPRHPTEFFKEALPILDRYIAKGGAPRRWGEEE